MRGYTNMQVLWPIRAALTGVPASPGAFEMLQVLGKEESIARLQAIL
jgi:glutamyl/glutaminyl-tRNA synthetase